VPTYFWIFWSFSGFRRLSGIEKKIAPSEPARRYIILFLHRWTEQQP
jgi:hypothetical protein